MGITDSPLKVSVLPEKLPMLPKSQALSILSTLLQQKDEIKKLSSDAPQFTTWQNSSQTALEKILGKDSATLKKFKSIRYFPLAYFGEPVDPRIFKGAVEEAGALLASAIDEVAVYHSDDPPSPGTSEKPLARVEKICERFHRVALQLANRQRSRSPFTIGDEYDVQDLLHALLKIEFDDVRVEEWTPSYAGSSARMDFLLKIEQIVIEAKKTRDGLGAKEVGEQLIIDIEKYQKHSDCKSLVCLVYDPEHRISNPVGLSNDLSRSKPLPVTVYVVPRV